MWQVELKSLYQGGINQVLDTFLLSKQSLYWEQIKMLKEQRKQATHHTKVKDFSEKKQFEQLSTQSKHFFDTNNDCLSC